MNTKTETQYKYVYKTTFTNILNGECFVYIGKHETNDLNDGYIGSGSTLTYVKENVDNGSLPFKIENTIIKHCNDSTELENVEIAMIKYYANKFAPYCMNAMHNDKNKTDIINDYFLNYDVSLQFIDYVKKDKPFEPKAYGLSQMEALTLIYQQMPTDLVIHEKMLLLALANRFRDGLSISISFEELVKECSMSKRSVCTYIKSLEARGFINKLRVGLGENNNYYLDFDNMGINVVEFRNNRSRDRKVNVLPFPSKIDINQSNYANVT